MTHNAASPDADGPPAGRLPQRPPVQHRLRHGHRDLAAVGRRREAALRPLRLHRPAVPRGLRGRHHGLDGSGVTVAITDAYAWQLISKDANTYASQRRRLLRARPAHARACRRRTASRRPATRPAGAARRPSTSRPCTRWPPAPRSATTARAAASTTTSRTPWPASSTRTRRSSSPTPGPTSRRTRAPPSILSYEQVFLQGALAGHQLPVLLRRQRRRARQAPA